MYTWTLLSGCPGRTTLHYLYRLPMGTLWRVLVDSCSMFSIETRHCPFRPPWLPPLSATEARRPNAALLLKPPAPADQRGWRSALDQVPPEGSCGEERGLAVSKRFYYFFNFFPRAKSCWERVSLFRFHIRKIFTCSRSNPCHPGVCRRTVKPQVRSVDTSQVPFDQSRRFLSRLPPNSRVPRGVHDTFLSEFAVLFFPFVIPSASRRSCAIFGGFLCLGCTRHDQRRMHLPKPKSSDWPDSTWPFSG